MKKTEKRQTACATEPLVVMEQNCSYFELIWMIQKILNAPQEITRTVASFCLVRPVVSEDITVIHASSTSNQHPLSAALDDTISTWWISGPGTMPFGKGHEYVEFLLSPLASVCRLSTFSIQIPPLPMGPLSVRRLRLDRSVDSHTTTSTGGDQSSVWKPCSPIWTVENKTGWQEYVLHPPVDVHRIRVVCLTNQMEILLHGIAESHLDGDDAVNQFSSVGYYCVKFE
jgi:hypothetical protein